MKPLKFAMVTTFYPPANFGGDGIAVQALARGLARQGHEVTVIHSTDAFRALGGKLQEDTPADGVTRVPLESGHSGFGALLNHQLGDATLHRGALKSLLGDRRFDVIHFHNVSLVGGPGILSYGNALKLYTAHESWLVCPTHVLWRHGREACPKRQCLRCLFHYRRPPQLWRYTGKLNRCLRHIDTFIALSEFSKAKHREFGFPRDMRVIPNFLPDTGGLVPRVGEPEARPYFLFVGRLEALKGIEDLKPTFESLTDADLVIAGDGVLAGALRESFGGMSNVRFLGRLPPERLDHLYRNAVALLAPSRAFETFGLTIIEAFRQGTPVVARRIGPFPEIVESCGGGVLFGDQAEITRACSDLLNDVDYRNRLGQAGRDGFLRYWEEGVVLERYLDLVSQRLTARSAASGIEVSR